MTRKQSYNLFIIFLLFLCRPVFSDILYDASVLERAGQLDNAVGLYESWLSDNKGDERFSEILFHCSSIIESVEDSLALLFKYEKYIVDTQLQTFNLYIAQTYELISQYSKSAEFYRKASKNSDGNINYDIFIKYILLNYQMGNVPAMSVLNSILLSNVSSRTYVDSLIFKAELLKYEGKLSEAEMILQQSNYKNSYPEIRLALWEIYLLQNNLSAAEYLLKTMENDFPDSVELAIMNGEILKMIRLSDFFLTGMLSPNSVKSYIQVGSFSKQENIRAFSEKLTEMELDYFYISKNNITKIIISSELPSSELLSQLKKEGIEGFSIDYQ